MKKIKCGTWFLIPINDNKFALGIVARRSSRGVLFGYFFQTDIHYPSEVDALRFPQNHDHVLCGKFSGVGIQKGEWPVVKQEQSFDSTAWPMPAFVRKDESSGIVYVSEFDPVTFECLRETKGDESILESLPYDRMMGHVAVEKRLKGLL